MCCPSTRSRTGSSRRAATESRPDDMPRARARSRGRGRADRRAHRARRHPTMTNTIAIVMAAAAANVACDDSDARRASTVRQKRSSFWGVGRWGDRGTRDRLAPEMQRPLHRERVVGVEWGALGDHFRHISRGKNRWPAHRGALVCASLQTLSTERQPAVRARPGQQPQDGHVGRSFHSEQPPAPRAAEDKHLVGANTRRDTACYYDDRDDTAQRE